MPLLCASLVYASYVCMFIIKSSTLQLQDQRKVDYQRQLQMQQSQQAAYTTAGGQDAYSQVNKHTAYYQAFTFIQEVYAAASAYTSLLMFVYNSLRKAGMDRTRVDKIHTHR
jgi:hypothetical protein